MALFTRKSSRPKEVHHEEVEALDSSDQAFATAHDDLLRLAATVSEDGSFDFTTLGMPRHRPALTPLLPAGANSRSVYWAKRPVSEVVALVNLHNRLLPGAFHLACTEKRGDAGPRSREVRSMTVETAPVSTGMPAASTPALRDEYLTHLSQASAILHEAAIGIPTLENQIAEREELCRQAGEGWDTDVNLTLMRQDARERKEQLAAARLLLRQGLLALAEAVEQSEKLARSVEAQRTLVMSANFNPQTPRFDIDGMRRSIETNRAWSAALAAANPEVADPQNEKPNKTQQRRMPFGHASGDSLGVEP